jgi:peroxiredoxin
MLAAASHTPPFELKKLEGGTQSLSDLLRQGKPVALAFFKVSCPVCQLIFPYLERMAASDKVQFLAISQDDARVTGEFRTRFGITFPTVLDESRRYPASNAFGISSVPSVFLVEVDGTISMAFHGFSKPELERLGERAGVQPFTPQDHVPEWKPG